MEVTGGGARVVADHVSWAAFGPDGQDLAFVRHARGHDILEYRGRELYATAGLLGPLALSPDGTHLATADFAKYSDSGTIELVGLDGHVRAVGRGPRPVYGLAWEPSGTALVYGDPRTKTVHELRLDGTDRVLFSGPDRMRVQDIAPDGRMLVTREVIRDRIYTHSPGGDEDHDVSLFDDEAATAISPDGRFITVMVMRRGRLDPMIDVRPVDGSQASPLGRGMWPAISPSGRSIAAVATHGSTLLVYPRDGGEARPISLGSLHEMRGLAFTPDEHHLVFSAVAPGHRPRLYTVAVDGGAPEPFTDEGPSLFTGQQVLSPDGKWVVSDDLDAPAMLYPVGGGQPRPVPSFRTGEVVVGWTADGTGVFVVRFPLTETLDVIDLATGSRRPVPAFGTLAGIPVMRVHVTPDARAWTYTVLEVFSDAYVVRPWTRGS